MQAIKYSIGDLERLSGIKAHTIRVWETRYRLFSPERSEGNTRYYSESDMKKLLLVALLNKNGFRISKVAEMSEKEMDELAQQQTDTRNTFEQIIDSFLLYSIEFSQSDLIDLLNKTLDQYGIEVTFRQVVFPFLRKVGTLWLSGKITPGHEHFFSNICKQKLFAEVDKLEPPQTDNLQVVLFQPEWDFHELGILFYNLLLRRNGISCTYLGQAVPVSDACEAIASMKAKYAISSFITPASKETIENYIIPIIERSPETHFLLTGPHITFSFDRFNDRITIFRSIDQLKKLISIK